MAGPVPQQGTFQGSKAKKAQARSDAGAAGKPGRGVSITGQAGSPCLVSYPSASVPLVGTVGGGCLVSKTNVRAWVGGAMLAVGGLTLLVGVGILVAAGFARSGLADKTATIAGAAYPGAGAAIRTAARVAR